MQPERPEIVLRPARPPTALGCVPDFLDNRFVYLVISPRLGGLAVGVNVSLEGVCNFACLYCEVQRPEPLAKNRMDLDLMTSELENTLEWVRSGKIRERSAYAGMDSALLELREVVLSGNGEPTLSPTFADAVQCVMQVRAKNAASFFKVVLLTNGSGLDLPAVQEGLKFFTHRDEIWIKLDAGTQAYMSKINGEHASLEKVLKNALELGRQRPIAIQSLFPLLGGQEPPPGEIDAYLERLRELKGEGAQIAMVQVFSAAGSMRDTGCEYLPLKSLHQIRQRIVSETGIRAEVF